MLPAATKRYLEAETDFIVFAQIYDRNLYFVMLRTCTCGI